VRWVVLCHSGVQCYLIALAWATGARRAELTGLTPADIVWTNAEEGNLTFHGKGDKHRTIYIYDGAAAALVDWLAIRGEADGPLFCPVLKSGKLQPGRGMSGIALAKMLAKRAKEAKLSKSLTWHDFRRTFAGNLLDAGHDLATVQKLMGHASPVTTSNYDRRSEEAKKRAVRSLHIPYTRRP
jgi:integrase